MRSKKHPTAHSTVIQTCSKLDATKVNLMGKQQVTEECLYNGMIFNNKNELAKQEEMVLPDSKMQHIKGKRKPENISCYTIT